MVLLSCLKYKTRILKSKKNGVMILKKDLRVKNTKRCDFAPILLTFTSTVDWKEESSWEDVWSSHDRRRRWGGESTQQLMMIWNRLDVLFWVRDRDRPKPNFEPKSKVLEFRFVLNITETESIGIIVCLKHYRDRKI